MKMIHSLALSLIFTIAASADTEFPRKSFVMADFEKAKAAATAENKPLALIYTDKVTTCGLCQGAAAEFIDAVKSKTVVVYLDSETSKTWWSKVSDPVQKALKVGKFIPKVVVTDATGEKVTASLTYEAYKKDEREAIRGLKKALKAE